VRLGYDQRVQAKIAAQDEVNHLGQIASNMQSVMVDSAKNFLLILAHTPTVVAGDQEGCQNIFSHLVSEHFEYYSSFYVADLKGNILCSPPGKHAPPDFETCDHFQNLILADDFTFSGYHICRQTGKAVLSIGYPIFDQGERVLVTNVSLDLNWFYDFAADSDLPEGSELVVMDDQGTILMHYPENDRWRGFTVPKYTALAALLEHKEGTSVGEGLGGGETVYAVSTIDDTKRKLTVALGVPTDLAYAGANLTLKRDLIILVLVMVVVIVLMWFLGDAIIVKQAQSLVQTTRKLAQGNLSARTGLDYSHGELGQLAQSFDSMADQLAGREKERDQNEAALTEYARSLEKSNQELRDFANIASHDLQEPLRKIQTFGDLLEERCQEGLNEMGRDYVKRMQDAAERMQLLVSELLAYSRVSNEPLPYTRVDMNKVTRQVLKDLDWQIDNTKAQVHLAELPVIEADLMQMTHLMQNLIGNALKFHRPGIAPVVSIYSNDCMAKAPLDGICEILVKDEGVGFNEKYLGRIFQPFQRLNGRNEYEGSGMGLAICRKIVERHGGSISAQSTPGKGTIFTVRLPLNQPQERLQTT
jgi:signal transduction histidine kinase